MTEIVAHIDGAARGNPGPAAYAVVMETTQGAPVAAFAKFLGETTNNVAEYQGLLAALDYALNHHFLRLNIVTDSELMARQIAGRYKVRSPGLKPLHEKAQAMIASPGVLFDPARPARTEPPSRPPGKSGSGRCGSWHRAARNRTPRRLTTGFQPRPG